MKLTKFKMIPVSLAALLCSLACVHGEVPVVKAPRLKVLAHWNISLAFPAAGIYQARFEDSPACLLVAELVCFAFNVKSFGLYGLHTHGGWYSPRQQFDLSTFNVSQPICGWKTPHHTFLNRMERVGLFSGRDEVDRYMRGSGIPSKGYLWRTNEIISDPLVIVSPRDSHVGHFVESVHTLAEVARHLSHSERSDILLFFSSHHQLSSWTVGLARAIFGPNLKIATRADFDDTCFSRVAFPVNVGYKRESVNWLRERAYSYANVPTVKNRQITIVRRLSHRSLTNIDHVASSLRSRFPHIPLEIVTFEGMTFSEQVQVMHRTLLYVSPHGASMSNIIFLQSNSTMIEFMPYKFEYRVYMSIGVKMGLKHHFWENKYLNTSAYKNNCYLAMGYDSWTERECHASNQCVLCIRDGANITVSMPEFNQFLSTLII